MKTTAQRMKNIPANYFAALGDRIAALEAAGCDVIRLDTGSPDLPPAPAIVAALVRSAASPHAHGYQPHKGTRGLRAAWAEMYRRVFRVDLDPESEVVPLLGSKEGIFNFMLAILDPGDVALIPDPGYITYTRSARFAGGEPYPLPLLPERGFLPDLAAVPAEIARRAKVLWLNYPNNPTAATAPLEFFSEAVAFAEQNDLLICHDAAYAQVMFDGQPAPSLLQAPGARAVTVEFNTLSKSHNMAGWRAGAAVGNAEALRALYTLKGNVDSGHFLPIHEAATTAMTGDQGWLRERNEVYRQRRDLVIAVLHALGLPAAIPQGSLYIWCPVPSGWASAEFAAAVLETAQVSLTPGAVFGQHGEGYVRISLTAAAERLEAAMERLAAAMPTIAALQQTQAWRERWDSVS
jgi:LL-diaminopimelate aminotransferase